MMLSILIPAIPDRLEKLKDLINLYEFFIKLYKLEGDVEIVSIVDNRKRSIGRKRNDLIEIAQGHYFVISDDDDRLTQLYFELIKKACETGVDVITYLQEARINDDRTLVRFGLKNENQEFKTNSITLRPAWHCCTWKRDFILAHDIQFPEINYGEDEPFARLANERAQTSHHIDAVCHVYVHDSTKTAAFDERSH